MNIAYTTSAKNKIKAFFTKIDKDQMIEKGKDALYKAIRRKKLSINDILNSNNINLLLTEYTKDSINDLYYDIGLGKYNPSKIIKFITKEDTKETKKIDYSSDKKIDYSSSVIVDGIDNLKVNFAGCCMPVKGDQILGYISKGNGIVIHRCNCHNIIDISERIINVKWNEKAEGKYISNILIYTEKKDNLLLDIISKTTSLNIGIKRVNNITNDDYNLIDIDILVDDLEKLDKYITSVQQLPYVTSCQRGNK